MEAIAEAGKHRCHVFGGLDELPLHVVNTSGDLDVGGELIHQLGSQHGRQGIGMAEVGREAVEGVAQSPMAMEAGEERKLRLLFAQHIGAVADWIVAEGTRQAGQHHLLSMELFAQATGFLEVFFDVIAVGAEHHKFAALDQIAQRVGDPLVAVSVAAHVEHGLHVLIVHRCNRFFGERSQKVPARARGQQQTPFGVLHGAVVGQRGGIEPDAVETHLAGRELLNAPADCAGVEALIEEGIAHAGKTKQRSRGDCSPQTDAICLGTAEFRSEESSELTQLNRFSLLQVI